MFAGSHSGSILGIPYSLDRYESRVHINNVLTPSRTQEVAGLVQYFTGWGHGTSAAFLADRPVSIFNDFSTGKTIPSLKARYGSEMLSYGDFEPMTRGPKLFRDKMKTFSDFVDPTTGTTLDLFQTSTSSRSMSRLGNTPSDKLPYSAKTIDYIRWWAQFLAVQVHFLRYGSISLKNLTRSARVALEAIENYGFMTTDRLEMVLLDAESKKTPSLKHIANTLGSVEYQKHIWGDPGRGWFWPSREIMHGENIGCSLPEYAVSLALSCMNRENWRYGSRIQGTTYSPKTDPVADKVSQSVMYASALSRLVLAYHLATREPWEESVRIVTGWSE